MAIFSLAVAGNSIKLGTITILGGGESIVHRDRDGLINLGSGHDTTYYDVLDDRYKIPPTGWSE